MIRQPRDGDRCEYVEDTGLRCVQIAAGRVEYGQQSHPLCHQHLNPNYHPLDLHDKLVWEPHDTEGDA